MDEEVARTIQTVAAVLSIAAISITILTARPTSSTEMFAVMGGSFSLIAALLGVHYSVKWARNGHP